MPTMRRALASAVAGAAFLARPLHATPPPLSVLEQNQAHVLSDGITYVTRPDIDAPRWNITVYDEQNYSPGYWFVATYDYLDQTHGTGGFWNAPHIFDNYGELIWSGSYISQKYDSFDFKISNVLGQDMLTWYYPRNRSAMILNDHYTTVQSWQASDMFRERDNMHDLHFVQNGTFALYFYNKNGVAMSGDVECRIEDCCFRERNMLSGRVDFEWCASDHMPVNESTYGSPQSNCRRTGSNWDFLHANALDKFPDPDNSYLLSGRYTDTIYKIHPNGTIIWRFGGPLSDFEADFTFARQHHSRILSHNETHIVMSMFDNAISEEMVKGTSQYSRGIIFVLNTSAKPMTATLIAEYPHPWGDLHYTYGRGSTQLLDGGNVFQCWVDSCLHSEHTTDGKLVMEAHVRQEWLKSYRSYKFKDFVGLPSYPPDVHSAVEIHHGETKTVVHASWNGATEVRYWRVYSIDPEETERKMVGEVQRSGFETRMVFEGFIKHVQVSAYDEDHKFLGWTNIFNTLNGEFVNNPDITDMFTDYEDDEVNDDDSTSELPESFGNHPSSWKAKLGSPTGKAFVTVAIVFIVVGSVILVIGGKYLAATTGIMSKRLRRGKKGSRELRNADIDGYDSEEREAGEDELFIPPGSEKA